jgi:hypothetical protein
MIGVNSSLMRIISNTVKQKKYRLEPLSQTWYRDRTQEYLNS